MRLRMPQLSCRRWLHAVLCVTLLSTMAAVVAAFQSSFVTRPPLGTLGLRQGLTKRQEVRRNHRHFSVTASPRQGSSSSSSSSNMLSMHLHGHGHHTHFHDEEKRTIVSSSSSSSSSSSLFGRQRRNALIRVGIVASVMLLVASRSGGFAKSKATATLNICLTLLLSLFLATVERSRGWLAEARANTSALWNAVEAHVAVGDDKFQQEAEQERLNHNAAEAVTIAGTVVNILLSGFKLFAGIVGHSSAMVADAGHSLSDLASDIVTLWSVRIGRLPADDDHPYGHGRFEALGALIISSMLCMAGVGFGTYAYEKFILLAKGGFHNLFLGTAAAASSSSSSVAAAAAASAAPTGRIALIAAALSIASKEALYRATAVVAKRTESQVLLANAWHHRSDAFSSVVALFSIWGATSGGVPALDPLGGLFVAGMVGATGLRVGWTALKHLTDTQDFELKAAVERAVRKAIRKNDLEEDVLGLHAVRARYIGSRAWVDMEVETNPSRSASAAAHVAKVLRNAVFAKIPSVADVVVVLKPKEEYADDDDDADDDEDCNILLTREKVGTANGESSSSGARAVFDAFALSPKCVEKSVREALQHSEAFAPLNGGSKRLRDISSVLVHFSTSKEGDCDVDLIVSADEEANLSVSEAKELAEIARRDVIRNADGVRDAKVSLELVRKANEDPSMDSNGRVISTTRSSPMTNQTLAAAMAGKT